MFIAVCPHACSAIEIMLADKDQPNLRHLGMEGYDPTLDYLFMHMEERVTDFDVSD